MVRHPIPSDAGPRPFLHRRSPHDPLSRSSVIPLFGEKPRKDESMNTRMPDLDAVVGRDPPVPIGLPTLAKMAFDGVDLAPVWNALVTRVDQEPRDAAAYLDLSTIAHIQGRPKDRLVLQALALEIDRVYRQPTVATTPLRLLAFMAPGDFLANMPIEFMLEHANVTLDMVYVLPGQPLPQALPDHDVAIVAVSESSQNQQLLRELDVLLRTWPRPVVNAPDRIARLTRDGTWALLRSAPGVTVPINARIDRPTMARIAGGDQMIGAVLTGETFPIIARPLDSHAGEGLEKLDDRAAFADYLLRRPEEAFYLAPFIDYRGPDGLYRKYRVALIAGRPFASHMAVSTHWMIHYLNADRMKQASGRAEEAHFMATFDEEFAARHATALEAIARRVGLEYLPFDCGETRDGRLLIFETGTNMIVHAMDSPELFPYKRPQMQKVFAAFETMLRDVCRRAPGVAKAA
jgi:glutathione synthase/RimK-type ligase-like ATP-grasp enzyme